MELYSLFFFSCLLHSLFYPLQFTFSLIDCIIHISVSHLFSEIAVQPVVLFLSQYAYFLFSALPFPNFLLQFTLGELQLPKAAREDLPLGNCRLLSVSTDCGEQWSYWSSEAGFTKTLEFRSKLGERN